MSSNGTEGENESGAVELERRRFRYRLRFAIGPELIFAVAAALLFVDHAGIALSPEDAEPAETPLALSIARQVVRGPGEMYGPFSGENPLVLIHAPLYYRIAGAVAWSLTKITKIEPIEAALVAGRSLSFLSFLALLAAIARLSTLDGVPTRAAFWTVFFAASTPLIVDFAIPCRADLFAIAAQTWGATLLLHAWRSGSNRGWIGGFLAFAVAFCAKQHDIASMIGLGFMIGVAVVHGRLKWKPIAIGLVSAATFAVAYLLGEEFVSSSQMINAVFRLPGRFSQLNPAGWTYVLIVFGETLARASGVLAAIAIAALVRKKAAGDRRLDRALWFLTGLELAFMVVLCRNNDGGAWINYGLQPVVYLCAIAGRLFARIELVRVSLVRNVAFCATGCVFLLNFFLVTDAERIVRVRDRTALHLILNDRIQIPSRAFRERYFVGRQGLNRLYGNRDLIHDEWLYTSFERVFAAEPRDLWLTRALRRGPILQVITLREPSQVVPGVEAPLQALGFRPITSLGPYKVWDKKTPRRTR